MSCARLLASAPSHSCSLTFFTCRLIGCMHVFFLNLTFVLLLLYSVFPLMVVNQLLCGRVKVDVSCDAFTDSLTAVSWVLKRGD